MDLGINNHHQVGHLILILLHDGIDQVPPLQISYKLLQIKVFGDNRIRVCKKHQHFGDKVPIFHRECQKHTGVKDQKKRQKKDLKFPHLNPRHIGVKDQKKDLKFPRGNPRHTGDQVNHKHTGVKDQKKRQKKDLKFLRLNNKHTGVKVQKFPRLNLHSNKYIGVKVQKNLKVLEEMEA